ncbi:MAG TPA: alginate export family protein [Gammaproteobacteria bacterium]|nr:alginate export family protein [Gammaproteobacteria bacterium]
MSARNRIGFSCVLALGAGAPVAPAYSAETFADALREGDAIIDLRARYESVEQGGFASEAEALTNRLRAGYQTAPLKGTTFLVEGVIVDDLVDDYNSTTNGQAEYPVVADPADFAAINRFAIINKSLERTTLTFGRQRIIQDDQRFVGNVGWRQNEQTFDALRAQWGSAKIKTDLTYASQVNRVFGPDSPQGKWEGDVMLASFAYTLPIGTLSWFDYYLDVDGVAAVSTNTAGMKLAGSKPLGKLTSTYALAFAQQGEAGLNTADVDADYGLIEGGLNFAKFGLGLGYELLGGDGTTAFQTPLATLHAFQGWADKFLTTPAAGIEDAYLRFSYPLGKRGKFTSLAATAVFHDYNADAGSLHYGEELDLQFVARTERMVFTAKYADYRADGLFTDTDKLWLSFDYAF